MIIKLQNEDLNSLLDDQITIVDFYADWCRPCKMLGPQLEELAKDTGIKVIKVNTDQRNDLASQYGVMSIPHLVFFKNKKIIKVHDGFMNKQQLINELKSMQ